MSDVKRRVYEALEVIDPNDKVGKEFDIFIIVLVIINITALVLATVKSLNAKYFLIFDILQAVTVIIFSLDYVARIWACTSDEKYAHPVWGRLRYMINPLLVIDFLALAPFYAMVFFAQNGSIVQTLSLFRVLWLLKITRYSPALRKIDDIIKAKKDLLIASFLLIGMLLLIASGLMFIVENQVQPDKFSSIPATMWWGGITLTTTGYGDVYPVTGLGKFLGGIISFLGVCVFALPGGILAAGFIEHVERKEI